MGPHDNERPTSLGITAYRHLRNRERVISGSEADRADCDAVGAGKGVPRCRDRGGGRCTPGGQPVIWRGEEESVTSGDVHKRCGAERVAGEIERRRDQSRR